MGIKPSAEIPGEDSGAILGNDQVGQVYANIRIVALNIDAVVTVSEDMEAFLAAAGNITTVINAAADAMSYRDAAAASALTAGGHATDAAASATAANTSKLAAAASATAADGSETAAAASATAAAGSATAADASKTTAVGSANTATTKAAEALASATAAALSKTNSDTSAANAAASAAFAAAAKDSAEAFNVAAGTSAGDANTSAVAAAGSALTAGNAATAAQTAQAAAEAARDEASAIVGGDFIPVTEKGNANGVVPLGADTKISAVFLPSYVDDVVEADNFAELPAVGETGKIYVTIDTTPAKTWRWSGTGYAEIVGSPGSTDAIAEGATNLYFTNARVFTALTSADPVNIGGDVTTTHHVTHNLTGGYTLKIGGATEGWIQFVQASGFPECHVRPAAGKKGVLSFTEDGVADRWSIGTKPGDSTLYFSADRTLGNVKARLTPTALRVDVQTIEINSATGSELVLEGPDGTYRSLYFKADGVNQYSFGTDASGGFGVNRYSYAGAWQEQTFAINRTNGIITFNTNVIIAAGKTLTVDSELVLTEAALGAPNGVAPLGADTKIDISYLPDSVLGSMQYQSTWNATTNTPAIPAASAANKGNYYKVATAGTTSIDGIAEWAVGDWIISNGVTWDKIDNSETVSSVAGLTGAISVAGLKAALTLVKGDVGLGNVDNTSDSNKPVSTAQQTALDGKSNARPTVGTKSDSFTAADADNNSHYVFSGASKTLTLNGTPAAGTSFTGRFTTAWAITCANLSKNGAAPVANGSIAANKLITFLHEGAGVWIASGDGLT